MRKTFSLIDSKKSVDRMSDAIKFEVKKYIKRERNKKLPEGADFWDFDCKIGKDDTEAKVIKARDINTHIDEIVSEGHESFYLEILAKTGNRIPKTPEEHKQEVIEEQNKEH